MANQTTVQQMATKIFLATRPEDLFGSLDGSDRAGIVGKTIPVRFANLTVQMDEICGILTHPSLDASHKLLRLFREAVSKIRLGTYAATGPSSRISISVPERRS